MRISRFVNAAKHVLSVDQAAVLVCDETAGTVKLNRDLLAPAVSGGCTISERITAKTAGRSNRKRPGFAKKLTNFCSRWSPPVAFLYNTRWCC